MQEFNVLVVFSFRLLSLLIEHGHHVWCLESWFLDGVSIVEWVLLRGDCVCLCCCCCASGSVAVDCFLRRVS